MVDLVTGLPGLDVIDQAQADVTASGMEMYQRSTVRALNGSVWFLDARVGSFNVGSGNFYLEVTGTTINKGVAYEVHSLLPPAEKDLILTEVIEKMRVAAWDSIPAIDGATYSLGPEVLDVLDVAINPYPAGSVPGYTPLWWKYYPDPHTNVLFVGAALPASAELAYRAVTTPSLGLNDMDAITLDDDGGLLARAAAHAYWLLERRAPAQEVQVYQRARAEMMQRVRLWAQAHPILAPQKIQLDSWG